MDLIQTNEETLNFKEILTQNSLKQYAIGVIFLKMKNEIRESGSFLKTSLLKTIKDINKNIQYISELNHAIYLTGAFFGYKQFYKDYYQIKDLSIFRKNIKYEVQKSVDKKPSEKEAIHQTAQLEDSKDEILKHSSTVSQELTNKTKVSDSEESKELNEAIEPGEVDFEVVNKEKVTPSFEDSIKKDQEDSTDLQISGDRFIKDIILKSISPEIKLSDIRDEFNKKFSKKYTVTNIEKLIKDRPSGDIEILPGRSKKARIRKEVNYEVENKEKIEAAVDISMTNGLDKEDITITSEKNEVDTKEERAGELKEIIASKKQGKKEKNDGPELPFESDNRLPR